MITVSGISTIAVTCDRLEISIPVGWALNTNNCDLQVRAQACSCLTKVANSMVATWQGPPAMMAIFRKMFGSHSSPTIIRQNNFTNFQHYFILKVRREGKRWIVVVVVWWLDNVSATC